MPKAMRKAAADAASVWAARDCVMRLSIGRQGYHIWGAIHAAGGNSRIYSVATAAVCANAALG